MKSPEQESFYSFAFECFRMVPTGAELTIHSPGLSLSHSGSTFYSERGFWTKPGFKTLWVSFIVTLTTTPLTPNSIHSKASEEKLKTLTFPHYFVTFTTHSIYFLYFSIVLVRVYLSKTFQKNMTKNLLKFCHKNLSKNLSKSLTKNLSKKSVKFFFSKNLTKNQSKSLSMSQPNNPTKNSLKNQFRYLSFFFQKSVKKNFFGHILWQRTTLKFLLIQCTRTNITLVQLLVL